MKEEYYVYAYLDPRKPGFYKYENYIFSYEPIYIGKGIKNRIEKHLKLKVEKLNYNSKFYNTLNKLKNLNLEPIKFKLEENLNDYNAKQKEIELITKIGRLDLNKGTLLNLTDGGEGVLNPIITSNRRNHSGVFGNRKLTRDIIEKSAKSRTGLKQKREHKINACIGKGCKPILQYNLKGEFIKEFELGFNFRKSEFKHVNETIRRGRRMAYGYLWIFKNNVEILKIIEPYTPTINSPNKYKNIKNEYNCEPFNLRCLRDS